MDLQPAAPPPPGVTPNFVNPPAAKAEIFSVSIGLCTAATIVLVLRLYTRGVLLRSIGVDDYCVVFGQLCAWIFCIVSLFNTKNGYGVHIWNLYIPDYVAFKKYDLAEEDVYCVGTFFIKLSILVFYFRLNPNRRFRQMTYAIIAFVAAYSVVSILVFTLMCRPAAAQWDVTIPNAKCINQLAFIYANAAFNILSDVATIILPFRLCWSLQTSLRQKLLLMLVFVAGSFACVVAIIRIVTMMPYAHSIDATYYKVTIAKWCMVEINVGTICACLPTIRPLLRQSFPKLFGTSSNGGESKATGAYALKPQSRNSIISRAFKSNASQSEPFRGWETTIGRDKDSDTESAERIVKKEDGIIRSTEYSVTYESGDHHV